MSSSFTYDTLVAALQATVEDGGSEFETFLETAVSLAEDRVLRDLNLEYFDVVTVTAFVGTDPVVTKPTGTVATRSVFYRNGAGQLIPLDLRSWDFCNDYWPDDIETTSDPKYYADLNDTEYWIAGTPAGANELQIRSIIRPTGLSTGNQTTWLSQYMGDLLFYACLVVSEQFLKADPRIPVWQGDYADRLAKASTELKRAQRRT